MVEARLYGADFLRATACLVVVFHHLAQRVDPQSWLGQLPVTRVFNSGGGFGVGVFFVLSGFLLSRPFWIALDRGAPLPSLRVYAMRRLARIVPGYWLALTVTFVLSIMVFNARPDGWLWLRFASGLLLVSDWHWTTLFPVEVNGPLWSIGFEVTSYALMPLGFLALWLLRSAPGWQVRLSWLGVIAVALLAHWLFYTLVRVDPIGRGWSYGLQGGAKTWMPWFNPFGFFVMFATGALAGGLQTLVAGRRHWGFDVVGLLALSTAGILFWQSAVRGGGEFYGWLQVPYGFPAFHLSVGLTLAMLPQSRLVGRILDNAVTGYVARISFGLYVWHYLVLELVRVSWVPEIEHGTMRDPVTFLVTSAVIMGITAVIASLSWKWLEAPVIGWARRLEASTSSGSRSTG